MTRVIWSPQSIDDLESIQLYINKDSPYYAALVVGRLIKSIERLESFPLSGRVVPEVGDERIREVIEKPYRVVYRVRAVDVEIVTVFRASRLLPAFD